MQGTVVMLLALSGLGCHHKKCEPAYTSGCYSSCYSNCYSSSSCYSSGYSRLLVVERLLVLLQLVVLLGLRVLLLLERLFGRLQLVLFELLQQPASSPRPLRLQAEPVQRLLRAGPGRDDRPELRCLLDRLRRDAGLRDLYPGLRGLRLVADVVGPDGHAANDLLGPDPGPFGPEHDGRA